MVSLCLLFNVDKNWLLSSVFSFREKGIQSVENGHTKKLAFLTRHCLGGDRKKDFPKNILPEIRFLPSFLPRTFHRMVSSSITWEQNIIFFNKATFFDEKGAGNLT